MKKLKYNFIDYKNNVIYTESTANPEATEKLLIRCGFQVGGFQLA